jgi:hypothetical protein
MTSRSTTAAAITLVAGLAFIAGRASDGGVASGASAAQPEGQDAMMMGPPAPGPIHKHLEQMVGDWKGTVRFKMDPSMDWMESTGEVHREAIMDGRFVLERVTGETMGQEFKGLGIVGYNDMAEHYESFWIENMANHMSMATGSYDPATKTFTFEGDMANPMTGEKVKTVMTMDASDPNKEVTEGFVINADGSRMKNFEATFTRAGN